MSVSTRFTPNSHRARAAFAAGLVAFSVSGPAWTIARQEPEAPSRSRDTSPASITTISTVAPGEEKIELSGRLTQDSTNYADSIDWIIKSSDGETLFTGAAQVLALPFKPGTYSVAARYGNVAFRETIELPANVSVSQNFVLKAGALRIEPRLTDEGASAQPSITDVIAVSGPAPGQIAKANVKPGETLKLAAGTYRVETRFPQGNAQASTVVEVKAGVLRSVEIALHAAVVEFPASATGWLVSNGQGEKWDLAEGVTELVLRPGAYVAESRQGAKLRTKAFTVEDGRSLRLTLD